MSGFLVVLEQWLFNYVAYLKQNYCFKVREGKYQTRIQALKTLALGTTEENEIFFDVDWFGSMPYYSFIFLLSANFLLKLPQLSTGSFKVGSTIEGANLSQALSLNSK